MAALRLTRPPPARRGLSVVPLIDVIMILLFFFMISSSYLNLDMVPALEQVPETEVAPAAAAARGGPILLRIGPDGALRLGAETLTPQTLAPRLQALLQGDPQRQVLLFPSGAAPLQALITALDGVTQAGATQVKVIRVEAQP